MPPAKRAGDEAGLSTPLAKASRTDLHGEFQHGGGSNGGGGGGKRKSNAASAAANSRTGQACDRCKIRKIRCDARPGGCSPCLQNNTECTTTDRISGHARSRGHTERLENENAALKMYVGNLQQQLREHKIEPVGIPPTLPGYPPSLSQTYFAPSEPPPPRDANSPWESMPTSEYAQTGRPNSGQRNGSQGSLLADFRHGCIGDNYLGVSGGNSWLSPIEGSSLSLFGAKLDLSEYMTSEDNSPNAGVSYASFIDHALSGVKVSAPPLPPWETAKMYGDWYFRSIQPFIPLLHKPDFFNLLHRIYHENYQATKAETVMVHAVIAMLDYQYTSRNGDAGTGKRNWAHWQYTISFVPELIKGHTLEDVQGLVLICAQLRAFARPGAAWMFTNVVLGIAIELGLHRSASAWHGSAYKDARHLEMRQRTFWSIIVIHVNISGKLGRPMPMRLEDIDVEIPECTFDNLPEEEHLDEWRKCSWRAGRYGFELTKVMMKVYSSIYAIRSPIALYESHVRQLSKELKDCVAAFPPELSGGKQSKDEDRISALYLELSAQSCQLLIHHPAISRQPSPQIMNENLDACLEAAGKMLSVSMQINLLKSLDYTLYFNMDNLAAIFTTLFAHTERRDSMTATDLHNLRQEMQQWLEIMGSIGNMMGSGNRLRSAISNIVEWSLGNINRHIVAKTASAAVASTTNSSGHATPQPPAAQPPLYRNGGAYGNAYANGTSSHDLSAPTSATDYEMPPPQIPNPDSAPYAQQQPNYGYPDPQVSAMASYTSAGAFGYATDAADDLKPNIEAQLAAHAALQAAPQQQQVYPQFQSPTATTFPSPHVPAPVAWRNFAENMVSNMIPDGTQNGGGMNGYGNMMVASSTSQPKSNGALVGGVGGYASTGASFGEMQMPGQNQQGGMDSWPLIHYENPQ